MLAFFEYIFLEECMNGCCAGAQQQHYGALYFPSHSLLKSKNLSVALTTRMPPR
jgi:hypothetical protein